MALRGSICKYAALVRIRKPIIWRVGLRKQAKATGSSCKYTLIARWKTTAEGGKAEMPNQAQSQALQRLSPMIREYIATNGEKPLHLLPQYFQTYLALRANGGDTSSIVHNHKALREYLEAGGTIPPLRTQPTVTVVTPPSSLRQRVRSENFWRLASVAALVVALLALFVWPGFANQRAPQFAAGPSASPTAAPTAAPTMAPTQAPSVAPTVASCPPGVRYDREPVVDQAWKPTETGWIVLRAWSNQTDPNWPPVTGNEYVVLYGPDIDQRPMLYVGGAYWIWQDENCARTDFAGQITYQGVNYDLTAGDRLPDFVYPTAAPTSAPPVVTPETCKVIAEYRLDGKTTLTTVGSFIHVEFFWNGEPERETILQGGEWMVNRTLDGFVWEYHPVCTFEQVMAQVNAHIGRRLADSANNAGYVEWTFHDFFTLVRANPPYTGGFVDPDPTTGCRSIHDYQLGGYSDGSLPEVATSGAFIHVEHWLPPDGAEYESLLPGGRYTVLNRSIDGWVWEYSLECTDAEVMLQIGQHIQRRIDEGHNNGGFVDWTTTGYFQLVPGSLNQ